MQKFGDAAGRLARNPLGIIALFIVLVYGIAGLVFSTAVKSLTRDQATVLVWFLALFPVAVLAAFVWLVASHHEKLYAPYDFRDDAAFLNTLPLAARRKRLDEEVEEIAQQEAPQEGTQPARILPDARGDLRAQILLAQELGIRAIEREYGVPVNRDASLGGPDYGVDGLFGFGGQGFIVEVKYVPEGSSVNPHVVAFAAAIADRVRLLGMRNVTLILVVVAEEPADAGVKTSVANLEKSVAALDLPVQVRLFGAADLRSEYGV